ncbi:nuclear transport factor 2 family protein [Amphritea pacifica]|uniref:Nuclear transport factor 2 family protein n=1 Tax=Amphritea pacifica TaxID=2811233 RepID=A0ABS2W722_9GAMM|nr:nuclear transport factor 2 family protein [Amphritea pacifica]MBN0987512.1 nuclear transport factor 2 family protein [Amphritea pacifica]
MSETVSHSIAAQLNRYAICLAQLTPAKIADLGELVADEIQFTDPFNRVQGKTAFLGIMEEMFRQLQDVRFDLLEWQLQGHTGYIYWRFSAASPLTGSFSAEGVSRICLNEQGLVTRHQDFWDASILMQEFPLLGRVIGYIRKRAAYKAG